MRAIIIPLYSHTSAEEVAEIIEILRGVGIDDAYETKHDALTDLALQRAADELNIEI